MASKQSRVLSLFDRFDHDPEIFTVRTVPPSWPLIFGRLKQGQRFSVFKENHQEEVAAVYNYLISLDSFDEYETESKRLKGLLNKGLYIHAVSVALLHRKDKDDARLPPLWQVNPTSFFPSRAIKQARRLAHVPSVSLRDEKSKPPAPEPFITGTQRDPEFKMAWWREDSAINAHHMHWHQAYPGSGIKSKTGVAHVKERQGELFYYMHHQMLARYDADRIAVGLHRVEPYADWDLPIPEGYNSHLTDYYGSNQYAPRPKGMILTNVSADPSHPILLSQQKGFYSCIIDAINSGEFVMPDTSLNAVDIVNLGAAVEATVGSPNRSMYGSFHNTGHDMLASITDPDGRYKQDMGVMGDVGTAVRDPIFFRWHKHIDDIFDLYKSKLDPYIDDELKFDGVTVNSIEVKVVSTPGHKVEPNVLTTRMEKKIIDIQHDMFLSPNDEKPNTPVNVMVNQVNHDEFEYNIAISATKAVKAAIRLFIAPSRDHAAEPFELENQRRLFIEMDKFVVDLKRGRKSIKRSSNVSSVIKPPDLTYEHLSKRDQAECPKCSGRYCECGWPQHMLLPRGTAYGMTFDLFVMVTDWSSDSSTDNLDQGSSYCGVKNKTYPDSRAMGFPFDRKISSTTTSVSAFAEKYSNMKYAPITIKWSGEAERAKSGKGKRKR